MKCVCKNPHLQILWLELNKYDDFHALEAVGRGCEAELQVG